MQATETGTSEVITLKGSTAIVNEFFEYSINSILYQRGIYPPESFKTVNKYGLPMVLTEDDGLKVYLKTVLGQLNNWLGKGNVQQIVLVITGEHDKENLERWVFNIETDKGVVANPDKKKKKSSKEVTREIQAIIRQITSSVTFLPLLDQPCEFDLLVYTDFDVNIPEEWQETDPKYVTNSEQVRLRSFTTKVHKVDALVSYKVDLDDEESDADE